MGKIVRIPVDEFRTRFAEIFDRVRRGREIVVVELDDADSVTLRAGEPGDQEELAFRTKTESDYAAFLRSAGSWTDFDADAFMEQVYRSRDYGQRPKVDLYGSLDRCNGSSSRLGFGHPQCPAL